MKKICTLSLIILSSQLFAQTPDKKVDDLQKDLSRKVEIKNDGWTKGGLINIGIMQGLLENWGAGGERMSLTLNGQFNGFIAQLKGSTSFESTLDMYYGLNYVASSSFVPRKLDDRIDFSSRIGLQPKKWTNSKSSFKKSTYFTGLFRFQTQFTEGFNYEQDNWQDFPTSEFMSPAFFTLAIGTEFRPNPNFSFFISPIAAKFTTVKAKYTTNGASFGVEQGKTNRLEFGAYLTSKYKAQINKNITYTTRLDLYSNYLAKNTVVNGVIVKKDSPGNIDILWDNFLAMKINRFIGASLGFTIFYDNDQPGQKNNTEIVDGIETPAYGPLGWIQLKQVLNVGFSYKIK